MDYYKKNRYKNNVCTQSGVDTKDNIFKFRIKSELKNRIVEASKTKGISASKFVSDLIENHLNDIDEIEWQKEVTEW